MNVKKLDEISILQKLHDRKIKLIGSLENYRTRKTFECHNKKHQWECTVYDIIERQHSCSECGYATKLNDKIIDTKVEELNLIRKTENGMRKREVIKRIGNYKTHDGKIEWECLVDKHCWLSTPHDILFRGVGCPLCHVKSETLVYLTLIDKLKEVGIETDILRQKELVHYKYDGKDRTAYGDFWFQVNNRTYIIEYNGKQHYELVFFGSTTTKDQAKKKLKKQKFRDNVVKKYAKDNDIDLMIIDGRKINNEKKIKEFMEEYCKSKGWIK